MSAYAALVSLLQILQTILHSGGLRVIQTRAQLEALRQKVILALEFLESSSTCKGSQRSALETKMRVAAYRAEDDLEYQLSRVWHFQITRWPYDIEMTLTYIIYAYLIVSSNAIAVSNPEMIYVLAAAAVSTATTAYIHLAVLYDRSHELFDRPEKQKKIGFLRRVLEDFNTIEEDAAKVSDDEGGPEISVLISLRQILDSILDSDGRRISRNRAHLECLHEKVSFLLDFLENAPAYMETQKSEVEDVDSKIRVAAYTAKSLILCLVPWSFGRYSDRRMFFPVLKAVLNSSLTLLPMAASLVMGGYRFIMIYPLILSSFPDWIQFLMLFFAILALAYVLLVISYGGFFLIANLSFISISKAPEIRELPTVINEFSVIIRNVVEIKDAHGNPSHPPPFSSSSRQNMGGTKENFVVGLDSDLLEIKARLLQGSSKRQLVSIVGMGGIGKTTLARQVYKDQAINDHFDVCARVTVSQENSARHALLSLLGSAHFLTEEECQGNDNELALYLHKCLMYRRYLIVMDDVWDAEIWDFLSRFFPDNNNGSRVLVTSRLPNVASRLDSSSHLHHMRCLNQDDGWCLLREKVFGAEDVPPELESVGKEIAASCGGQPLAIIVIGGLLYKEHQREIWIDIAKNLRFNFKNTEDQCLEILGLSYNHLPHHLRPCFLYMGVFPRNCEIPVSRLISLWVAEGFLKPCETKSLEQVAKDNLNDLIDRNLILICEKSCNGRVKTCSIHDLLRDVCVQNSCKENFFHVVNRDGYATRKRPNEAPRRISMSFDAPLVNDSNHYVTYPNNVRSLLHTSSKLLYEYGASHLYYLLDLRVLDSAVLHLSEFPNPITSFYQLRYLAFHSDGPIPPSISNLQNLQTIVHHHCSYCKDLLLPGVIWSMTNLRHIIVKPGCYLSDPPSYWLPWKNVGPPILQNLQTLVGIRGMRWTKGIVKRIPNLKKLGISYDVSSSVDWSAYHLESLVDLHQLESLKITVKNSDLGFAISHDPPKLAFPQKLKKLTLSGCGIPWTSIGALPNLEALKLRHEACSGSKWETFEGDFPRLIFLLLEQIGLTWWETDESHFPRLQRLVIRSCGMLEEIPSTLGDIPSLEMIQLVDCRDSAVASAKEILEEQESMGNEVLKVCIGLSS